MKNYLVVILLFLVKTGFSQNQEVYYQTSEKNYAFKLYGNTCSLYELSNYGSWVNREWELPAVYRPESALDSLGILFSNEQYAISYDYKYFRVCKLKNGKIKERHTYVAKKLENPAKLYEAINHSYWEVLYRTTIDEMRNNYPGFHAYRYPYYRYGSPEAWESLTFKQAEPSEFEVLSRKQNQFIKDSLIRTNNRLIFLNDSIETHISTLTLEALKSNFMSRPIHVNAYDEYQQVMLKFVAEKRPDLFYDLVESLPEEKKYLFHKVSYGDSFKSLKKFETVSPVKREFLKYKRKESLKAGLMVTGAGLLEVGVIGGAITGIVYWIRK
ncbi:hypothetical protein [Fluviicola sp.]|uniref:hypothetical protein n=1 Tax=Fluviicola sp. TaxID=1917219 RepID=UPI0031D749FA